MTPDADRSAAALLALSCTRDGEIVEILRDDLAIARVGSRLPEIVDPGSARKAENLIAALRERGSVVGWELHVPHGGGARPLSFSGAAGAGAVLIVAAPAARQDMDARLYEELSRLNNELINRERELARKTAVLERLAAEKSRIAAIAAHDLRNPLTIIAAYADLLKMDAPLDGDPVLYVEEIGRSARYMMELVEEMLDSSLLESGRVDVDLQEVDLVAIGRHAATINRIRAERKEITLAFEACPEQAPIRADPVKLRRIISNLVVNAIKFSPSHTLVTIRVRRTDDRALLEVEDEGIGIPRENLGMIFEPFKTLGHSGTAGEKSTGLGLAIVKELVALHGGTVEVESEVGRGSLFRVAFPIAR